MVAQLLVRPDRYRTAYLTLDSKCLQEVVQLVYAYFLELLLRYAGSELNHLPPPPYDFLIDFGSQLVFELLLPSMEIPADEHLLGNSFDSLGLVQRESPELSDESVLQQLDHVILGNKLLV